MKKICAIDVGGSSIKYGIVDEEGNVSAKGSFKTPDHLEAFYDGIVKVFNGYKDVEGMAMSLPGAVDSESGIIYGASALPYIHGPNIKEDLEARLHTQVEMENDANCAALAEVWKGAAKDTQDSCFVVCGTGIGGAVVKNRAIHKGIHLHGGEFGYMIMDYNADEDHYITWSKCGSTIVTVNNVAKELGREVSGHEIFDHEDANPVYKKHVNRFYTTLATGIYNIQYAYDPEVIIIGGGISSRDDIVERVNERLEVILEDVQDAKIKPVVMKCVFANDANLIGAAYHFFNR
ncbi:MAG: ROK family protein [Erysipelotrichaceae bacterium]|nr:ROK family protein [Erysipelotrichaceae bacterium]